MPYDLNRCDKYILMAFDCTSEEDNIAVSKATIEIEFVISSENEIEIEGLGYRVGEISDQTIVGLVRYFLTHGSVFGSYLFPNIVDVCH